MRLIVCLLSLLVPPAALATSYAMPGRELTRDDRIALTVQRAGLILVGHAISEHDTTVSRSELRDSPVIFQKVKFASQRRLKGPNVRKPFTFCSLPSSDGVVPRVSIGSTSVERPVPNGHTLLFVQDPKFEGASANTYGGALQRTCSWYAIEASNPYYLNDRQIWSAELENEVRRAIARQEIDALVGRADWIVLGRVLPIPEGAKRGAGYTGPPRTIAVAKTFKGTPEARLDVQPVLPFWHRSDAIAQTTRDYVWLLRRTENGGLEPVELLAGILEVQDGRIPAWGMSVDELSLRIESTP